MCKVISTVYDFLTTCPTYNLNIALKLPSIYNSRWQLQSVVKSLARSCNQLVAIVQLNYFYNNRKKTQ